MHVTHHRSRSLAVWLLAALLSILAAPSDARAQGFISGLLGYNFSGDAGCPAITDCQDKHANWGVSVGTLGIIGFEEELAYAKNFFGETPDSSNSVLTLMSNLMIAPGFGPVNPYVTGGVGLMRTHTDFTLSQLTNLSDNQFAWDMGGGVIVSFGHVGIRGDIRHFHSFQDKLFNLVSQTDEKLDFGRASAALVLKF
jgi:opacity protein-like surface antigen